MLSPYKHYRHDMKHQRVRRTWGPKGKPAKGCYGTICYHHKNVDWTVHRLTPAMYEKAKPGGRFQKKVDGFVKWSNGGESTSGAATTHTLRSTSPRWGEGKAPSRMKGRKIVPPTKHASVSKKTKVAAGVAVAAGAGYGGYRLHKHFHNQKVNDRDYYYRKQGGKQVRVKKGR